ncbi:MAG: metallophosphoesterase family protein [Desulfonatronovibrio sp.]
MKIVFMGDPHGLLDQAAAIATAERADLVILAGDQPQEESMDEIMHRFSCQVRFILGNHDMDQGLFLNMTEPCFWPALCWSAALTFDPPGLLGCLVLFRHICPERFANP